MHRLECASFEMLFDVAMAWHGGVTRTEGLFWNFIVPATIFNETENNYAIYNASQFCAQPISIVCKFFQQKWLKSMNNGFSFS